MPRLMSSTCQNLGVLPSSCRACVLYHRQSLTIARFAIPVTDKLVIYPGYFNIKQYNLVTTTHVCSLLFDMVSLVIVRIWRTEELREFSSRWRHLTASWSAGEN